MILEGRTHFDCEPTLTDSQVLDFTKAGYLKLEGVVPDEVSARCFAWLDEHAAELDPETNPAQRRMSRSGSSSRSGSWTACCAARRSWAPSARCSAPTSACPSCCPTTAATPRSHHRSTTRR